MSRRLPPAALLVAAAVLATTLTSCGGSSEAEGERRTADLSTCLADATAASMPSGDAFPRDWPFPPGTVVYHAEDRGSDGTIVTGIASSSLRTVLHFMNVDVVGAGFEIEKGETEEHDAEAEWAGNGFRGRWAIRESAQCPGETVVQVLAAPR